jgi:hypothetical protein
LARAATRLIHRGLRAGYNIRIAAAKFEAGLLSQYGGARGGVAWTLAIALITRFNARSAWSATCLIHRGLRAGHNIRSSDPRLNGQ